MPFCSDASVHLRKNANSKQQPFKKYTHFSLNQTVYPRSAILRTLLTTMYIIEW